MKGQGRYRIHAVAELTGVPEATLRAWERRYAMPAPDRTASGYRLYSQKDVEQVRRMRELCEGGMAPADAAKALGEPAAPHQAEDADSVPVSDAFEAAAARIVQATRRMDSAGLESAVRMATLLAEAASVVERVFCPALEEIGRDWERGLISVGHEHLASEILTGTTRQMLRLMGPARPVGEVLLACFAEEDHVLPMYAAGFHFVEWGYRPYVLGARTPPVGIRAAVKELQPNFVGLSSTICPPLQRAAQLVDAYADVIGTIPWVVGGAAASELRTLVEAKGGYIITPEDPTARQTLGKLLKSARR